MRDLTIGEAARRGGVGVETIRFYERRGLIEQPAKPEGSGFRVYPAEVIKRIQFIRQAQQLGFSLREIEELLALKADPNADCSEIREQAMAKLREVRRRVEQLQEIGAALEAIIALCPGQGGIESCSILDRLAETEAAPAPPSAAPPRRGSQDGRNSRQRRTLWKR